jgi:thiosulfate/3-mercaptopyruvate sulfurtransferase
MKFLHKFWKLHVIAGFLILAACSDPVSPNPAGTAPTPMPETLVGTDWLKQHLGRPDLVVLDVTVIVEPDGTGNLRTVNGRSNYESGHIPTAGFADLMDDLSNSDSPLQFGLPSPEQFAAAMGRLGIGDDSRVVLYDTQGGSWAARVWWMLRWIGFDRAALLDGGLAAWTAAGGSLSTEPVERDPRSLAVNLRPELIAGQKEVRAAIDNDAIRLIDALPAMHYRGEWTMYDQRGHIPGAANVPVSSLFDEAGHFRPVDELAALFGDDKDKRTITYCGGGIAASADAFALTRLGFTDVAIYAASLEEWTANPENPMEIDWEDFGRTDN